MKNSRLCLIMLAGLAPAFIAHSETSPQNSIPALLQFAEQYQQQAPQKKDPPPVAEPAQQAAKKTVRTIKSPPEEPAKRPGSWQTKDTELQRLKATIAELKQQLAVLQEQQVKQPKEVQPAAIDWQGVSQLAKNLRQALAVTPTERQAAEQLKQLEYQRSQLAMLKLQYSEQQQQLLQARAETKRGITESDNALATLRKNSEQQITQLQTALATMHSRSPQQVSDEQLKTAKTRQDYAAGVSLGEEILQMQAERTRWGVKTDKQLILAGISDTFAGERRLADDILNTALASAEKEVNAAREKTLSNQTATGSNYLAKFKQDKQVKQANSGFWYKIDYAGDTAIATEASVDVVVKEMLTDGTVVQDMEASGATLSQPVADFPPLFKEAISLLKNHGSMTLVVPPEQAYGEKGYPPKVPPNATMIYQLRIAEMYPAGDKHVKPKTNAAAN
ncbi:FKBP-type peptidyl-prolyl cis-trans isomerase N-terminal domain-containing protein [Serratia fonticola]|uniref:FKBP-type peptidyl-prolyl cis-trans isomerase N-terminal domain-containing protein n=1 Tax=Serratia fonticola TaxID=47917 RepID=UPI00217C6CE4|nr:FKBP-type peptidyl-prolyl cis-trans isomerase N-terminal domain-containing protein [Serratia fonticola]CAI1938159.1 FKBP-type peptidyl-prolyl cis-trans isomerase fkpA precursor [Serratia fonticola]